MRVLFVFNFKVSFVSSTHEVLCIVVNFEQLVCLNQPTSIKTGLWRINVWKFFFLWLLFNHSFWPSTHFALHHQIGRCYSEFSIYTSILCLFKSFYDWIKRRTERVQLCRLTFADVIFSFFCFRDLFIAFYDFQRKFDDFISIHNAFLCFLAFSCSVVSHDMRKKNYFVDPDIENCVTIWGDWTGTFFSFFFQKKCMKYLCWWKKFIKGRPRGKAILCDNLLEPFNFHFSTEWPLEFVKIWTSFEGFKIFQKITRWNLKSETIFFPP